MQKQTRHSSLIDIESLQQQKESYLKQLKDDLFYEAHETLEDLWFPLRFEKDDEVRLIRAYINAAVSFELVKRGREKSGLKPWGFFNRYKHLIEEVVPEHKTLYEEIEEYIFTTQKRMSCFKG